jgi:Leucine Rich Repeat (LRR) protein
MHEILIISICYNRRVNKMRKLYIIIFFFLNLNFSYAELPADFNWRIYVDSQVNPDLAVEFSSLSDDDKEIQAKKHYETTGRDAGKSYQYTRSQKEAITDTFLKDLLLLDRAKIRHEILDENQLKLCIAFQPYDTNWSNLTKLLWLTKLGLKGNDLTSLPDSISNLVALTTLDLRYNRLASLPDTIGNLVTLTKLDLSINWLTSLPDSIGNLKALTRLKLNRNHFTSLPHARQAYRPDRA